MILLDTHIWIWWVDGNEKLSPEQRLKYKIMKAKLFNELIASVREGGKIMRGKSKPSRTLKVDAPDIKKMRLSYKLSYFPRR